MYVYEGGSIKFVGEVFTEDWPPLASTHLVILSNHLFTISVHADRAMVRIGPRRKLEHFQGSGTVSPIPAF